MELQFKKTLYPCLDTVLWEVRNQEQTLEIRLPEGLPDVGRIVAAWGQPVLRSKEWRSREASLSGGIQVWVLYAPEDGTRPRCLEGWMPVQMHFDLPEDSPEGSLRVSILPRFVDARSVSARKIMVRAGVAAMMQALCPMSAEAVRPEGVPEDMELLEQTYPLRLPREAGEKTFQLDEELTLPPSAPEAEKLIYFRMQPCIGEQKVLGSRLVFRGSGKLHVLYASEEGQLFSWDFEIPISQFAELKEGYSPDAQADVLLCPTSVELELDEEGHFCLKSGMTAQYLVDDVSLLELAEDAYIPGREVKLTQQSLELPAILETRRETLSGEQAIPSEDGTVADVQFLPDYPRQFKTGDGMHLEASGTVQILCYGEDGMLRSGSARWEGQRDLPADDSSRILTAPGIPSAELLPGGMAVKLELPLTVTTMGSQGLPMLTGAELGEPRKPDPQRPSLILRRAEGNSLWELAKASGSTRSAIRKANGLEADPVPGQMLLIPVGG